MISVAVSIALSLNRQRLFEEPKIFYHPYAHQVFAIVAGFLLVFRSQLAYQRFWEARTQLAYMQAKWSDAAMMAVIFDDADGEPSLETEVYRMRMIHLFSLLHALAIQDLRREAGEVGLCEATHELAMPVIEDKQFRSSEMSRAGTMRKMFLQESVDKNNNRHKLQVIMGITDEEKELLWECQNTGREPVDQVFRCVAWVMREVGRRWRQGGLGRIGPPAGGGIPPPVLSRLHQVLSDGHHAFMQTKKVSRTPFPLPYAQLVLFFLIVLMFSSPFVIVAYVANPYVAGLLSFCASLGYFALNEVGRELEDPFRHDPNDLPLTELHYDFNVRLVSLLHMGSRQNGVNHINSKYLQAGEVRNKFQRSFHNTVTNKTEIPAGSTLEQLPDELQQSFQGNFKSSFNSISSPNAGSDLRYSGDNTDDDKVIDNQLAAINIESEDMPMSPRGANKATGNIIVGVQ